MRPALVAVFFAALTVLFAYPLSLHPGTLASPGDPDTDLFMWTLAWNTHALLTQPWDLFDANIFYPLNRTLAYSENLLGSTPIAAPVLWAGGNHVLALNAVALTSVLLCGLGGYLLARRLDLGRSAAVVCGMIFAFSPSRFSRYGQIHLATVHWIPFALAFLHTYFSSRRRRDLLIALGCITLQVLSTGHGAVFMVIAVAVLVSCHVLEKGFATVSAMVRDAGWRGAVILAPAVMLVIPYRIVQQEMGLRRWLQNWAAVPESFLASPAHLPARINSWLAGMPINDTATAYMFPGYLPIACTALALLVGWRTRRSTLLPYLGMTLLSLWLAIGSSLSLWPWVYWWPGFNFIRVPSRFIILATLGFGVLSAIGFDTIVRGRSPFVRKSAFAAAVIVMILEFSTMPFPSREYRVDIPAIDQWLASRPRPFAIAEIPVGTSTRWHSTYMLHSMSHWQPTVHGYSGIRPALHEEVYAHLRKFPEEEGITALARLGVRYLVVHTDYFEPGEWTKVEQRFTALSDRLVLEHVEGAGRVYSIKSARENAAR